MRVLVARRGARFFAVGATCTHYSGPLHEGLLVNDTVRCPWHHACFQPANRRSPAGSGPVPDPLLHREARARHDLRVTGRRTETVTVPALRAISPRAPSQIVIVGAGGGRRGSGSHPASGSDSPGGSPMIGAEPGGAVRPAQSLEGLPGGERARGLASPLKPRQDWDRLQIRMELGSPVTRLDPKQKTLSLENGRSFSSSTPCCSPTGASPVHLNLPGAEQPHVHYLRSLADCRAIIAAAGTAKSAVVIGASFHRSGSRGLVAGEGHRRAGCSARQSPAGTGLRSGTGRPHPGAARKPRRGLSSGKTTASIGEKTVTLTMAPFIRRTSWSSASG